MDVGVVQMPVDPWKVTVDRAGELEAMGFDHLWLYDHLSWKRYRDESWHATLPWLTGLAGATERIRVGTMVASPTLRHPLMLAKEAMSIDHVSDGRLILGLGAGGAGFDATAYGDRPLSPAERADRLEEYATVVDGLLRGTLTDHEGRWYTVDGARLLPGCVQRPRVPLALAAGGPRTLRLTASVADAWITLGDPTAPAADVAGHLTVLAEQSARLDRNCERIGRDPGAVERIAFLPGGFNDPLADGAAFADFAGSVAELGFDGIVFHDHRDDDPALAIGRDTVEAIAAWRQARTT